MCTHGILWFYVYTCVYIYTRIYVHVCDWCICTIVCPESFCQAGVQPIWSTVPCFADNETYLCKSFRWIALKILHICLQRERPNIVCVFVHRPFVCAGSVSLCSAPWFLLCLFKPGQITFGVKKKAHQATVCSLNRWDSTSRVQSMRAGVCLCLLRIFTEVKPSFCDEIKASKCQYL